MGAKALGIPIGGLLGMMIADDAEAAKVPGFEQMMRSAFYAGKKGNRHIGDFEPHIMDQIKAIDPNAVNDVITSPHFLNSRGSKQGWSPERAIEAMGEVLDDTRNGVVVKNWQAKPQSGVPADYGILMPYDIDPSFAPFFIDKGGKIVLKTIFPPSDAALRLNGYGVKGGKTLIPRILTRPQSGLPSAQQLPISVVIPNQASLGNTLFDLANFGKGKKAKGVGGAIGLGSLMYPYESEGGIALDDVEKMRELEAMGIVPEPGLEEPLWSPIDGISTLLAPGGTVAAKAVQAAAEPIISYAADKGFGGILDYFLGGGDK